MYLVRAAGGVLYTGVATDVARRLAEHRSGRGAKYLRGRGPLELVLERSIGAREVALRVEARIKRLTKSGKEELLDSPPGLDAIVDEVARELDAR